MRLYRALADASLSDGLSQFGQFTDVQLAEVVSRVDGVNRYLLVGSGRITTIRIFFVVVSACIAAELTLLPGASSGGGRRWRGRTFKCRAECTPATA